MRYSLLSPRKLATASALCVSSVLLAGCTGIPDGTEAVTGFELDQYLGEWYEIARLVPEGLDYFRHTLEGPDDMPAHVVSSLLGTQLCLAVRDGRLALGTWQGIWLGEHREQGGPRRILATITGC